MSIVEIENLTKDFAVGFWKKRPVRALDGLSLQINQGEVFGFLGPNGAGKSTTIKLLMNLLYPTSGSARILGKPASSTAMRENIGYLPENPYFYDYLTPVELLTYVGRLFGLGVEELKKRTRALIEDVGLVHAENRQLRKFSKGMVQRLGIAQALINEPKIAFFDEPMSGLDPVNSELFKSVIREQIGKNKFIIMSSHQMATVEEFCENIVIMNRGEVVLQGNLNEIKKGYGRVNLSVKADANILPLAGECGLEPTSHTPNQTDFKVSGEAQAQSLLKKIIAAGITLVKFELREPTLHEIFIEKAGGANNEN